MPLTSIVIYGKLFKIGIYKLLDNEFKKTLTDVADHWYAFCDHNLASADLRFAQLVPTSPYSANGSVKLLVSIWLEDARSVVQA